MTVKKRNLLKKLQHREMCCGNKKEGVHEREWEDQELKKRMCCHNIVSEPRSQTFMLHTHLSPLCDSQWTKLQSHWRYDESENKLLREQVTTFKSPYHTISWRMNTSMKEDGVSNEENRLHVTCVHIFSRTYKKVVEMNGPNRFFGFVVRPLWLKFSSMSKKLRFEKKSFPICVCL